MICSERQIDRIHERLIGIESALKSFSIGQTIPSPQSHTSQPSTQQTSTATPNQYEGDSSFQHQSVRATELAQLLNFKNDGNLSSAIDSLKDVLNAKEVLGISTHDVHFTTAENRRVGPQMEILPADFVIKIVNKVKGGFLKELSYIN